MTSASKRKHLAVIPARSGSKGLPGKNIKLLNKQPMLAYTIQAAQQSACFDEIIVSTNDDEIANIAAQYGAKPPFIRPAHLASDDTSAQDVLLHAMNYFAQQNIQHDIVTLLQPTSPLRTKEDILQAINLFCEKEADSVISVCQAEHALLWTNTLSPNHTLENFLNPGIENKCRQTLPIYYRLNGAIYVMKANLIYEKRSIYTNKSYPYLMPKERSIDVDDWLDFYCCEALLKNQRMAQ